MRPHTGRGVVRRRRVAGRVRRYGSSVVPRRSMVASCPVALGEAIAAGQDQGVSGLAVQMTGCQVIQPWRV